MAIAPVIPGAVGTPPQVDTQKPTPRGTQLKYAATLAQEQPLGATRANAFRENVLPILLLDASRMLGANPVKLEAVLDNVVTGSGATGDTLGLKNGDKGLAADNNYPPRAANAVWPEFAAALGVSPADAAAVTELNSQIGAFPPPSKDKYAPAFEQLTPALQQLATRVSQSLLGEKVDLTSTEQAFKASLVLNNLTWHTTNWQRAAGDPTRADPLARNNVFNSYPDNLAYALKRGGLPAVIDMAISDAYNAGKPGVGKAVFAQSIAQGTAFDGVKANGATERERLSGERPAAQAAPIPQRDVFAQPPPTAWIVKTGGEYQRVTEPPMLGTLVFHGKFQKQVTEGGYDMRGEKNSDTVKWVPTGEVTSDAYNGAGDPNLKKFSLESGTFMVRSGNEYRETTTPPPAGAEVFFGTFQKRVIDGGYDMRGEKNSDTVRWIPGFDVTSTKYAGAPGTVETF